MHGASAVFKLFYLLKPTRTRSTDTCEPFELVLLKVSGSAGSSSCTFSLSAQGVNKPKAA